MCNIAGIMIDSSIIDVDPDEFDRILSVNLKGVLYGCQAAGKVMVAQDAVPSSTWPRPRSLRRPLASAPMPSARPGGPADPSMAVEVGEHGVRVKSVAPASSRPT